MPPRPIRPKADVSVPEGSEGGGGGGGDSKGGRKRPVASACIPCRKRKSKCDGQMPSCSTCIAVYRTECNYDLDTDPRRKAGALKRDLSLSQQQNDALDVIVASLRALPENESIALLHTLRTNAVDPNTVADSLRPNLEISQSYAWDADLVQQPPAAASATVDRSASTTTTTTTTNATATTTPFPPPLSRGASDDSSTLSLSLAPAFAPSTAWFRHPQDAELIDHLLSLYRCWINPFYSFLCWDLFTQDMGAGQTGFCSDILANAVMAFACHYSDRSAARTIPHDPSTAGDSFYAEANRLLGQIDKPSLTTVQALGIMSLRETSAGRDSDGYQLAGRCVRMAVELGLHLSMFNRGMRQVQREVRKATFWAVFNLETITAISSGRLSQLPRSAADIETLSAYMPCETQTWMPYEDTNLTTSPSTEQPAQTILFNNQLNKLSEIASDMVNTFYAPRERFSSRGLAATYAQYQAWYRDRPEVFWLQNTSLPHVLVLHMYYYGCVLHLFRPYIKLDLRAVNLYPHDTCTFCANEISALMNALRAGHGLRRVSLAVTNLLLSASTIHLINLPSETAVAHLSQALRDLEAMSVNHRFAARAVCIIRSLATKWNIALPEGATAVAAYRMMSGSSEQRESYPSGASTFFAASIPCDQSSEGHQRSDESSHQESSIPALLQFPAPLPPSQSSPSLSTFWSHVPTAVDADQLQTYFWTPFPTQVMPVAQHWMRPDAMTAIGGPFFEGDAPWPSFAGSENIQDQSHGDDLTFESDPG